MSVRKAPLSLLISALALGACAKDMGEYPSLAKRPVERLTATYGTPPTPEAPQPLPQPDSSVLGRLDSLLAAAQRADVRFQRGEGTARRMVGAAGGARIGSDAWSNATIAVSELEAARGDAMIPLAELDVLYADAVVRGEDTSAIDAVRDRVIAIVARQDAVLGELRSRLGS